MTNTETTEVRQFARYQVRAAGLEACLAAIAAFVDYVRANEPGTRRYDVWQERDDPTRFVHTFVFRDVDAHAVHSQSAEVKKFAATLYPQCVAPVEFINYRHVASKLDVLPQGPLR